MELIIYIKMDLAFGDHKTQPTNTNHTKKWVSVVSSRGYQETWEWQRNKGIVCGGQKLQ